MPRKASCAINTWIFPGFFYYEKRDISLKKGKSGTMGKTGSSYPKAVTLTTMGDVIVLLCFLLTKRVPKSWFGSRVNSSSNVCLNYREKK